MQAFLFFLFSGLAVVSALFVIFSPKPTRALLSLIVTMTSLSGLYVLLGAPFIAMINLIVYAGAVLVLFLFVIMLQGTGARDIPLAGRFHKGFLVLAFAASLVFLGLFLAFWKPLVAFPSAQGVASRAEQIGKILFTQYLLPFELISILLILAVFAAVALAKKEAGE